MPSLEAFTDINAYNCSVSLKMVQLCIKYTHLKEDTNKSN